MLRLLKTIIVVVSILTLVAMDASAVKRTALVIGNSDYKDAPLKNPVNDANDITAMLEVCGFSVIHVVNATQKEMKKSVRIFWKKLKHGGVGLFYYAGHALQLNGRNYLIPIDSFIESETDVQYEAVDAGLILGKMDDAGNELNIVILDACRNNPFARSFRSQSRGLARMDAPKGSLIAYATSPGSFAADGDGRNGIYTKYLLKYMIFPSLRIEQVFKKVRVDVISETGDRQIPWESSSLTGDFYFITTNNIANKENSLHNSKVHLQKKQIDQVHKKITSDIVLDKKNIQINLEPERVKKPTTAVVMMKQFPDVKKDAPDENPFISHENGTVLDTRTGLMWASKDNGRDINWNSAKKYCEDYRGGGYEDWRMPTIDELKGLYDLNYKNKNGYHITHLIEITRCCAWASNSRGFIFNSEAAFFKYDFGKQVWFDKFNSTYQRALPVRHTPN